MQHIVEDLKNKTFSNIYLLFGEEAYLRRQYREKLCGALCDVKDTMNYAKYEGKDINQNEVLDLVNTLPFFAERRVVLVQNSGWFKNGNDRIADAMKNIPATTFLIFEEAEVDKRGKLYKAVTKKGYAAECKAPDEATLKKWIAGILKNEKKQITVEAAELFLEKTGADMENIKRELEKLICYTMHKEAIMPEDVEMICTTRVQNHVFEMIEAIAMGAQKKALNLYYDLLALKEPPIRILFLIGRQFNLLLQVKELKQKGYDGRTIAEKTGLRAGFITNKYLEQSKRFTMPFLRQAVEDCVTADEMIKTGKMGDVMSVELLIIQYSGHERASAHTESF